LDFPDCEDVVPLMLKAVVIAVNTNGWLVQIILSLKIEN
jgi:hypothetical protein